MAKDKETLGFDTGDIDNLRKVFDEVTTFYDGLLERMEEIEDMGGVSGVLGESKDYKKLNKQILKIGKSIEKDIVNPIEEGSDSIRESLGYVGESIEYNLSDGMKKANRVLEKETASMSTSFREMYNSIGDLDPFSTTLNAQQLADTNRSVDAVVENFIRTNDEVLKLSVQINALKLIPNFMKKIFAPDTDERIAMMTEEVERLKMSSQELNDTFKIARIEKEKRGGKDAIKKEIREQKILLRQLEVGFNTSKDVAERKAMAQAWEEENAKLEALNESLKEYDAIMSQKNIGNKDYINQMQGFAKSIEGAATDYLSKVDPYAKAWEKFIYGTLEEDVEPTLESLSDGVKSSEELLQGFIGLSQEIQAEAEIAKSMRADFQKYGGWIGSVTFEIGYKLYNLAKITTGIVDVFAGTTEAENKKRIELLKEEQEVVKELNDLIAEGNSESVSQQRRTLERQRYYANQQRMEIEATAQQNTTFFNKLRGGFAKMITGQEQYYGALGEELDAMEQGIEDLDKELEKFNDGALLDAIRRQEELNKIAEEGANAMSVYTEQMQRLEDERIKIYEAQNQLNIDLNKAQADFDLESTRLTRSRESEDLQNLNDHLDALASIESTHQDNLEDARRNYLDDLLTMERDFRKQAADARKQVDDDIAAIDENYNLEAKKRADEFKASQIEERQDFLESLAKEEEQYNEDKLERQKDLAESLFEAELANDALQFFTLKREQKKEEKETREDFEEQQEESRQQFEEQQAEKELQYAEEKQLAYDAYVTERRERYIQYEQDLIDLQEQFDDQREIRRIENERTIRDAEITAQRLREDQLAAYDDQLNDLKIARAQENADRIAFLAESRQALLDQYNVQLQYFENIENVLMAYISELSSIPKINEAIEAINDGKIEASELPMLDTARVVQEIFERTQELQRRANNREASSEELIELESLTRLNSEILAAMENQNYFFRPDVIQIDFLERILNAQMGGVLERSSSFYDNQLRMAEVSPAARFLFENGAEELRSTAESLFDSPYLQTFSESLDNMGLMFQTFFNSDGTTTSGAATSEEMRLFSGAMTDIALSRSGRTLVDAQIEEQAARDRITAEGKRIAAIEAGIKTEYDLTEQRYDGSQRLLIADQIQTMEMRMNHYDEIDAIQNDYSRESLDGQQDFLDFMMRNQGRAHVRQLLEENNFYDMSQQQFEEFSRLSSDAERIAFLERASEQEKLYGEFYDRQTYAQRYGMTQLDMATEEGFDAILTTWRTKMSMMLNATTNPRGTGTTRNFTLGGFFNNLGSLNPFRSTSGGNIQTIPGSVGMRGLMAAKGAYVSDPTGLIAGEKGGEVIMPFDESRGIPRNIMEQMGKSFGRYIVERQVQPVIPSIIPNIPSVQPVIKHEYKMEFGDITIGNDMSRTEVEDMFYKMQSAVVEVISNSTQGNLSNRRYQ